MTQTQIEELVVKLTADVNGFVKNFQQAQAQTLETTQHIQGATEKIKNFTESVTSFSQAALAGLAGIGVTHWFKEVFSLASDTEQQFKGLSAAVRSNTADVDNTVEAYKRFAEGMFEVTGTSKRTTLALLQMDEMQGLTAKRAMETARQAIALGAATGMDPQSLISRLNMAQTGSGIRMLQRVPGLRGMTDESAMVDKANRLMAIGMEVSKAQMQSAAGMVSKLREELEEVKKQFGKLLLDALKPLIELLTKTVQWFKDLDERTKLVILSLAGMTVSVLALVNGIKLLNGVTSILFSGTGGLLAMMLPLAVGAALWAEHLGGVSKAWEVVKARAQQFIDWIRPSFQATWDVIRIGAMVMANAVIYVWDSIAASFAPVKQLLVAGWEKVSEVAAIASEKVGSVWEPMEVAAASFAATLAAVGVALYVLIPRPLESLLPLSLKIFSTIAHYAIEMWPAIVEAVKSAIDATLGAISSAGSKVSSVLASIGGWFTGLPAKIQNGFNAMADFVEKLPALTITLAQDMAELVGIVEGVARAFRWVNDQIGQLPRGTAILAGIVGVAILLAGGLYQIAFYASAVAVGFGMLGDKLVPVILAFAAWKAWIGPYTAMLLGFVTLVAARTDLVWQALAKVKEFFNWIAHSAEWINSLANSIAGFFRWIGASIGPALSAIGDFFSSLGEAAVSAFSMLKDAASEVFGVIREIAGGVFEVLSAGVASFNWNLQNTVMVVAAAVGIFAAMVTLLTVWATVAKLATVAMALWTMVILPNKLAMMAINLLMVVFDGLLVLTGIKLVATTIAWMMYKTVLMMVTVAKGAFTFASVLAMVALLGFLAVLVVVSAALIAVVVVAFVAATSAVMAMVDALKSMTMFSGVTDTFKHWKSILGGLVTAIQVDMGLAWKHVQDAMHLAGEEVKAYWPPVWARIKEGFTLMWDLIAAKFKQSIYRMLIDAGMVTVLIGQTKEGLGQGLHNAERDLANARFAIEKMSQNPLDFGKITTPGLEKALEITEANTANAKELAKLKKAAEEEADKAAKKHKEELDTATKLNNLAQQHNELKQAELVLANSAEALYKIQAYRTFQQAALEARAAQLRKDALDQGPGKGPAQAAYDTALEAAKHGKDVKEATADALDLNIARLAKDADRADVRASALYDQAQAAMRDAKNSKERMAAKALYNPQLEAAGEEAHKAKAEHLEAIAQSQFVGPHEPKEYNEGVVGQTLMRIEALMREGNKKPSMEVKPVGLK